MNWLNELVDSHAEFETPISFWMWSGLVAISAVLKDQVWLPRAGGYYNLYPNIYCILYAESGLKKGPPINLAKSLVKDVNNTRIISGRSSIQGIMKKLGQAQTAPGGKIINARSHGFICSSELSASIVADPAALDLLTDLYDRNYNIDDWDSLLKMEEFKLRDPTLTLFGGINAAHAEGFFEKKDISGGFLARSFVIHESEENVSNSLVRRPKKIPDKKVLAEYLKKLAKLTGPFKELADEINKPTEVGEYYEEWYQQFKATIKQQKIRDETGTLNRFGDSVLKVSILLSLSKKPELDIDLESLIEAIRICEKSLGGIRHATHGKRGLGSNAQLKNLIILELYNRDNHQVSRPILMKKLWMHYSGAEEFDTVMESFSDAGLIISDSAGGTIKYTMPDNQVAELKRYFEGKNK